MPGLSLQFKFAVGTGTTFSPYSTQIPSTTVAPDGSNNFYSYKEKGNGYFGNNGGLHTVSYTITPNFVGTLSTQATLATMPCESDWFTVDGSSYTFNNIINPTLTTTTNYVNFSGNFVWVRAVVQRSIGPTGTYNDQGPPPSGSVEWVNYNY
jgi:hypothetical protein